MVLQASEIWGSKSSLKARGIYSEFLLIVFQRVVSHRLGIPTKAWNHLQAIESSICQEAQGRTKPL